MISNLAKNIIIKSGNYNCDIENHMEKYDPVLSELTGKNLDNKKNLKRLFDLETNKSHEEVVIDIVKIFDVEKSTEQPLYNFVDNTTTLVEKMNLLKRVSFDQQTQSNDYLLYLVKNDLLKQVVLDAKTEICEKESLEVFSQILVKKFCTGDLPHLYELLKVSDISEILSCACIDHKLLMILGAKIYIPYIFHLYEKGNFKFVVSELIYKLNFKAIQVSIYSLKNSASQFVLPTTILVTGVFFSGHLKGVIDLQHMKQLYYNTSKEYKFEGQLGEFVDNMALVLKKAGSAGGDLIKAPIQGFYFSFFQTWAESFFTTAEWWLKKK